MLRLIDKMTAPIKRRLRLLVTRGVVKLIHDAAKMQELQVSALAGELFDGVERIQQYGFTAHPHPGADCLILNVGANRAHPIVIAADDRRYRLHLAEGEVAMYDDLGQSITLSRNGMVINAPQGITINGTLINNGINLTTHIHTGDSGGTTGGPR